MVLKRVGSGAAPPADAELDWTGRPGQTKEQQVAEVLRERIFAGTLGRGRKLKQAEIARELGLSITPVRAALKLLEAEGFVRLSAHRGAVVAPLNIREIDELFDLRLGLEAKLVLAAVPRAAADDVAMLARLNDTIARAAAAGDRAGLRTANLRFHFVLYRLAALKQTTDFVRVLWAKYPFDLLSSVSGRSEQALREHAEIIAAVGRGDARAASRSLQSHLKSGYDALRATYALDDGGRA